MKLVIENGFPPLLESEKAYEVERLWHAMLKCVLGYGPQGIVAFSISAVDMALWDLKGRLSGQPVCTLLSGRLHDQVLVMASIHLDMENLEWTVDEFAGFSEEGYRIVKDGWETRPLNQRPHFPSASW